MYIYIYMINIDYSIYFIIANEMSTQLVCTGLTGVKLTLFYIK